MMKHLDNLNQLIGNMNKKHMQNNTTATTEKILVEALN
jgi:hypothetical protein